MPNEIEDKYDLCYCFLPENVDEMFAKIDDLLKHKELKIEWKEKVQKMLADKIDVTAFFTWFIENYPASAQQTKQADKAFWERFK